MGKRIAQALLIAALAASVLTGCGRDDESAELTEDLVTYVALCPNGQSACYVACGNTHDTDGSGNIEPSEQVNYDSCTGTCDSQCSLAFLLTLFQ